MKAKAVCAASLGAAAMFLMDPDRGRRRRAWIRDKCVRASKKTERASQTTLRDLRNRSRGVWAWAAGLFRKSNPSDVILLQRTRAQLGRILSHPQNVEVEVNERKAFLSGTVSPGEIEKLLSVVERVPGIQGVEHRLVIQEPTTSGQQSLAHRGGQFELLQNHWSPTARLLVGAAGSVLTAQGLRQGGVLGSTLGMTGILLLFRGVSNKPYRNLFRETTIPKYSRNTLVEHLR